MNIENAARDAGVQTIPQAWRAQWPEAQAIFEETGAQRMSPKEIEWAADFARMSHELTQTLEEGAGALSEPEKRLAWTAQQAITERPEGQALSMADWPSPKDGGLRHDFYALVFLAAVPELCVLHARRGIPGKVTVATLADIERWMEVYREDHGVWGLGPKGFFILHFSGLLYELGRLQFEMRPFEPPFQVYARKRDGAITIVAEDGSRFREDGQFYDADRDEAPVAWEARLQESADGVTANTVAQRGRAFNQDVKLPAAEWERLAQPGANALSVHIPAGAPLDPAACAASFEQAGAFFPRYFPEHRFGVFTCWTWMLDPQLATALPSEANLTEWLRMWRLFPLPGAHDEQTIERVFGRRVTDPFAVPPRTSLQRAVQQGMRDGVHWRQGGGVIPFVPHP
jgi:hypothetical protein